MADDQQIGQEPIPKAALAALEILLNPKMHVIVMGSRVYILSENSGVRPRSLQRAHLDMLIGQGWITQPAAVKDQQVRGLKACFLTEAGRAQVEKMIAARKKYRQLLLISEQQVASLDQNKEKTHA